MVQIRFSDGFCFRSLLLKLVLVEAAMRSQPQLTPVTRTRPGVRTCIRAFVASAASTAWRTATRTRAACSAEDARSSATSETCIATTRATASATTSHTSVGWTHRTSSSWSSSNASISRSARASCAIRTEIAVSPCGIYNLVVLGGLVDISSHVTSDNLIQVDPVLSSFCLFPRCQSAKADSVRRRLKSVSGRTTTACSFATVPTCTVIHCTPRPPPPPRPGCYSVTP